MPADHPGDDPDLSADERGRLQAEAVAELVALADRVDYLEAAQHHQADELADLRRLVGGTGAGTGEASA